MLLPFFSAILLHEFGHIFFLLLTGGKLRGLRISVLGITLKADFPPSYSAKILISLGGPFVGFFCYFLFRNAGISLSLFADISLALSLFNLLPISFLDGGCALESFFLLFLPYDRATLWIHGLSIAMAILIWGVAIYLFLFLNGSASLFLFSLWFLFSLLFSQKA